MNRSIACLKVVLWSVCAFHVIVGAGLNLFPEAPSMMADAYGAEVNWTPEFSYIIKPIGAFMLALGIIAAGAALDPLRHRLAIYAFVTLFLMRALQRLVFAQSLEEIFGISWDRNLGNVIFFVMLAATLVILDTLSRRTASRTDPSSDSTASTAA